MSSELKVVLITAMIGGMPWVILFIVEKVFPNPLSKVRTCEFCKYHEESACRRYPPGRVYTGDVRNDKNALDVTVWPIVRVDNWCGEFERKKP